MLVAAWRSGLAERTSANPPPSPALLVVLMLATVVLMCYVVFQYRVSRRQDDGG